MVINLTGPRFNLDYYLQGIMGRFNRNDDTSISAIMLVQRSFDEKGNIIINMKCVSKHNAKNPLGWIEKYITKTIKNVFESSG